MTAETMPQIFYVISTVIPATYYIGLERVLILRGTTLSEFWFHLVMLAGMGMVFFGLCVLRFRQKVA